MVVKKKKHLTQELVGSCGKNECSHNNCGDEWIGQARALAGTSGLNEKVGCEMAAREAKQCQR